MGADRNPCTAQNSFLDPMGILGKVTLQASQLCKRLIDVKERGAVMDMLAHLVTRGLRVTEPGNRPFSCHFDHLFVYPDLPAQGIEYMGYGRRCPLVHCYR